MLDSGAKIILIDDEPQIRKVMEMLLQSLGHEVVAVGDAAKGIALVSQGNFDLLITDIKMPKIGGIQVAQRVHEINPDLPVLLITGFPDLETARDAIRVGVEGYVTKPVQRVELDGAIKSALARKAIGLDHTLGELLDLCKAAGRMEKEYLDVLRQVAGLVETGRVDAHEHAQTVGRLVEKVARRMDVPAESVASIRLGAELRDIGLIGVPADLWARSERLTEAERDQVRRHAIVGSSLLSRLPIPSLVHQVVLHHHDRYDGSDNPSGQAAEETPLGAHIVAVVDAFDALISERPQQAAQEQRAALRAIAEGVGKQFHPQVVEAFLYVIEHEAQKD